MTVATRANGRETTAAPSAYRRRAGPCAACRASLRRMASYRSGWPGSLPTRPCTQPNTTSPPHVARPARPAALSGRPVSRPFVTYTAAAAAHTSSGHETVSSRVRSAASRYWRGGVGRGAGGGGGGRGGGGRRRRGRAGGAAGPGRWRRTPPGRRGRRRGGTLLLPAAATAAPWPLWRRRAGRRGLVRGLGSPSRTTHGYG